MTSGSALKLGPKRWASNTDRQVCQKALAGFYVTSAAILIPFARRFSVPV